MANCHYTADSRSVAAFDVPVPAERPLTGTWVTPLALQAPTDGGVPPSPFGVN